MDRILILGGGVGGTLTANLLVGSCVGGSTAGEVDDHGRRRRPASTSTSPGSCTSRWAASARRNPTRPERSLLDDARPARRWPRSSASTRSTRRRPDERRTRSPYDYLVIATGCRIVPEDDRALRDRGPPLLQPEAATRLRRALDAFDGRPHRHRHRRDALQVPAGTARGRVPHRGGAPRARSARRERGRTSARPSVARSRSRACREMATPILEREGHRAPHVLQRRGDRPGAEGRAEPRGRGAAIRPADPRPAPQGPAVPDRLGLAPAPGGWLPTDRHTLQVGGRPNVFALGDATDLPLSKAGSTAHFEAPVVAERHRRRGRGPRAGPASTPTTTGGSCASSRSATARARCSASTTTIRHGRPSRTSSGTSARSSSTRPTGTRCPRDGCDARPDPPRTPDIHPRGRRQRR